MISWFPLPLHQPLLPHPPLPNQGMEEKLCLCAYVLYMCTPWPAILVRPKTTTVPSDLNDVWSVVISHVSLFIISLPPLFVLFLPPLRPCPKGPIPPSSHGRSLDPAIVLFLPNLTVLSSTLLDPKSLSSPDLTFPPPLVLSPPWAIFHNCRPIVWAQSMIWPSHCAKCRCRFIQSKLSCVVGMYVHSTLPTPVTE